MVTPVAAGTIARGLGDLLVYPVGAADALGTGVDVPGIRTLEWSIDSDTDELEGDNTVIAIARGAKKGSGSLELGKVYLPAYVVMFGGTFTVPGTSPNKINTYEEPATPSTNYFAICGQTFSLDTSGSAYRVTIWKALAATPDESLSQGEWNTPTVNFENLPNASNKFIRREQFETQTSIPTTLP